VPLVEDQKPEALGVFADRRSVSWNRVMGSSSMK